MKYKIVIALVLTVLASGVYTFYGAFLPKETIDQSKIDAFGGYRAFKTSFESVDDFKNFYIVPQNHKSSSSHELSTEHVKNGMYSHKGWIYKSNSSSTRFVNNNHRGYPTIQLYKLKGGAFKTPALVEFWVWLDMDIKRGEWFSFATFDHTTSDTWDAILINLSDEGIVHTMHVPFIGQSKRIFQTTNIRFPMKKWVKLTACLDFDSKNGNIKVWQDDQLVSEAEIGKGRASGLFTQAHFGLYAPPSMSEGVIYNDDLVIKEGSCDR